MSFFYDGHPRLAFFFANPNHEGSLYLMAAFVFLAGAAWLLRRRHAWQVACGLSCGLCAAASLLLLALTYSRGAYVAFFALTLAGGACSLWRERRLDPHEPKWRSLRHFWLPAAFLLMLLLLPGGGKRIGTMASPREDLSIANRLYLWRGGTVYLAHNWLRGLETHYGQPARGYTVWLQPVGKNEAYRTFVSDVLTSAICHGLPRYGLTLALQLWGFLALFSLWRKRGRPELLWLLCAPASFLLCGVFNTCTDEAFLRICFLSLMAAVWGAVLWSTLRQKHPSLLRHGLCAFGMSALFCVALFCAGVLSEQLMPYRLYPLPNDSREIPSKITLTPRKVTACRRVLFFADALDDSVRTLLLPLASQGVPVEAIQCEGGVDSLEEVRDELTADGPLKNAVVVACGLNAPNTVCAALGALPQAPQNSSAIFCGLEMNHPLPELTPQLDKLPIPAFVLPAEAADTFPPSEENQLLDATTREAFAAENWKRGGRNGQ